MQIKLLPSKSRLVVKPPFDEKKTRDVIDNVLRDQMGLQDVKSEMDKNNGSILVNLTSDTEALQLQGLLEKVDKFTIVFEEREPFQELKDSIERVKRQKKDKNQMIPSFEANYQAHQPPQTAWQPQPQMQMPGYGYPCISAQ